jgi:hypothetical protein
MSRSKAGKAGRAASPWGRYPMVPRQQNYQRMRDWHKAKEARKNDSD